MQAGQGHCWSSPSKETSFELSWPSAGSYTVQVVPVRDKHGREFQQPLNSQPQVTVKP